MELGAGEMLHQGDHTPSGHTERKRKRKRDSSLNGGENKSDFSKGTSRLLESCGADSISATFSDESKKNKSKKKKGKKRQDVEVMNSCSIDMPGGSSSVSGVTNEGFVEFLCQEDCTHSAPLERRKKKKRSTSHEREEEKSNLLEETSPVLDSGEAEGTHSRSALLLDESRKSQKKRMIGHDMDVINSSNISELAKEPSSVSGDLSKSCDELLCQEDRTAPVQMERRKIKKHNASLTGEDEKTSFSEETSRLLDSSGAQGAEFVSVPLLNQSRKNKKNKRKKLQDTEVINSGSINMQVEEPHSVSGDPKESFEPDGDTVVPILEMKRKEKKKKKKKKKKKEKQETEFIDSNSIGAEEPPSVSGDPKESFEAAGDTITPILKKKRKEKKRETELIDTNSIGANEPPSVSGDPKESFEPAGDTIIPILKKKRKGKKRETELIDTNSIGANEPPSVSGDPKESFEPPGDTIIPILKKKRKGKKRETELIDTISIGANEPPSVSGDRKESFEPAGDTIIPILEKKRNGKKTKKEKQETELIDSNSIGADSVLQLLNNTEPVENSKKKKKQKPAEDIAEQHNSNSNNSAGGADSTSKELNDLIEETNMLHRMKKEKKKKRKQKEVANPDDCPASAAGSDPLLPQLNVNPKPIDESGDLFRKKWKINKLKPEHIGFRNISAPIKGSGSAEGLPPLLPELNEKAEPVGELDDLVNEKRRNKKLKTDNIGSGDINAPDKGRSFISEVPEIVMDNTRECSLSSARQNDQDSPMQAALTVASDGVSSICLDQKASLADCSENECSLMPNCESGALEGPAASLEKKRHAACLAQAAPAISTIEAAASCPEEKASLTDCLENVMLRDLQQGTMAVASSIMKIQPHNDDGGLMMSKQLHSQVLVESRATTNYSQGAPHVSGHTCLPEHTKNNIAGEDTDGKNIDPPAAEEVVSEVALMETINTCEPRPMFSTPLDPSNTHMSKKKLLILDLNGLLVDVVPYVRNRPKPDMIVSRKYVYRRPYVDDFLKFCLDRFAVAVWSSRTKKNMDPLIGFLFGDSRKKLVFCWHQSQCTQTIFSTLENREKPLVFKELRKVWEKLEPDLPWEKGEYNASNTLLLDDSPYKALCNPEYTAIFPSSYDYEMRNDDSLGPGGDLRVYLEHIASADSIPEFVRQNPFGQGAITRANPSWCFYEKVLSEIQPRKRIRQSRWDR